MRVPDEAGVGIAKVKFSFDAWSEAHVASSTIEIPVTEPDPEPETAEKPAASNEYTAHG